MTKKLSWAIALLCLGLLPVPSHAQCKDKQDQFCRNLQYILYAAQTDFRTFDSPQQTNDFGLFKAYPRFPHFYHSTAAYAKADQPDLSLDAAKVSCQLSAWTNGVTMYMCEGRIPAAEATKWYDKTLADLQQLQYQWSFRVESPGTDHFVDAGPADCDVATTDGLYITDGPYQGQCPLHLQTVRQADGSDSVHLWVTSYTSPFLAQRSGGPAMGLSAARLSATPANGVQQTNGVLKNVATAQTMDASAATATGKEIAAVRADSASSAEAASNSSLAKVADAAAQEKAIEKHNTCDEFCLGLKKILEDRWTSFKELHTRGGESGNATGPSSAVAVKLAGASACSISAMPADATRSASSSISRVRLTPATLKGKTAAPAPTQYVCYWPENSPAAAESQFHELVSVLEFLIPSTWSAHQQSQSDELSGAQVTLWSAHDAANSPAIRLYLSGQSVGLHVASASE